MDIEPTTSPHGYAALLADLKQRIDSARLKAALSVNRELVLLYWSIGRDILARQSTEGWGTKVIDRLAADLRRSFPEMTGLSARNLKYMRAFAEAWRDPQFVQQVVALLPWGHNTRLLDALKTPAQREWYARQAIQHGWSRNVLSHQIESDLFARQGGALTNFSRTLPAEQSELAQQIIKDPYSFDFLSLGPNMLERDLERGLIDHLEMPQALRGRAAGGYTTATFFGQFCATFVYGALLSLVGASATFSIVALVCFGVGALGGISSFRRHVLHLAAVER